MSAPAKDIEKLEEWMAERPRAIPTEEWVLMRDLILACKRSGVPQSEWARIMGALALTLVRNEMTKEAK